jgi:hypothetical protein
MARARISRYIAGVCLCLSSVVPAYAQRANPNHFEIYNGCGREGDARSPGVQALNRLKNRYTAREHIDPAITLAAILAPGRDTGALEGETGSGDHRLRVRCQGRRDREHQLSCSCCRATDRDDFTYEIAPNAVLYARPCRSKAGENDLAMALPAREPGDERLRIGCVHGCTFDIGG